MPSITVASMVVLLSLGVALQPGKYCALPVVGEQFPQMISTACIFFDYESPSKATLGYNYYYLQLFNVKYDNVVFKDGDVILKRRGGHTEGPELYPYFDVGFDLKVSPMHPDVVQMVAKDGTADRQPDGEYSAYPGPDFNAIHFYTENTVLYITGDATYELVKQGPRELFKFKNDAYKFSERFYKIAAEFFYDPGNDTVLFIPNDRSIPEHNTRA
ncbi:hypothetical protein FOZ60_014158 [Perkinsus olseni]|uniref:Uncharacterized protein n=1 Tax=Perkinsus olseni TaxID=32597 RepID=A0A7J6N8C6_PEROL|nr:hypothetical protein FOZ60_014158 [Perkinsus olseni]